MKVTILGSLNDHGYLAYDGKSVLNVSSENDAAFKAGDEAGVVRENGVLVIRSADGSNFTNSDPSLTVTEGSDFENLSVLERSSGIMAGGEGKTPHEAFEAMRGAAGMINANAVLNLKFEYVKSRFFKRTLFRCLGTPALLDNQYYRARPGIHLKTTLPSRTNSPNRVMARYIRVLLASSLLVVLPVVLRTCASYGYLNIGYTLCALIALLTLARGILIFPRARRSFIMRVRETLAIKS